MKNQQIPLCVVLPTFFFTTCGCPIGAVFGFYYAIDSAGARIAEEIARTGDDGGASEGLVGLYVGLPLGAIVGPMVGFVAGLSFGLILLVSIKVVQWVLR